MQFYSGYAVDARDPRKEFNRVAEMALVEDAGFAHIGNCSLDVRSKGRSCVRGESFGCLTGDRPGVWVRGGCRGQFAVGGLRIACGHRELGEQEQSCHAARFRSAGADTTDVWPAGSARALDDSKPILDRAPWQALSQALRSSATGIGTTILIGVINGHAERRAPFRCEFAQLLPSRGRLRFVVGSDHPARAEETDLLVVPDVPEIIHYHNHNSGSGGEGSARRWEGTGSMSSLLKLFFFLEWAARQPEQVIARVDDDVFVSLPALEAHAAALAPFGDYFYAGVFEWYSYIPAFFKSTGHSFGVGGARALGQRLHNCTPSAVRGSSPGSACVGPVAFAKGPLLLLSRAVARDAARAGAADIARARTFRPTSRVDDDVFLGSLVAAMPRVTYVRLRRKHTWLDRTPAELHPRRLLLAHKMPWECRGSAMVKASAAAGWARGALYRVACGAEPPCLLCAHAATQRTCAIQLEAEAEAEAEPGAVLAALQPHEPGRVAWCNVSQGFTPQPAPLPGEGDCAFHGVPKEQP